MGSPWASAQSPPSVAGSPELLDHVALDAAARRNLDALALGPSSDGRGVDRVCGRVANSSPRLARRAGLTTRRDILRQGVAEFSGIVVREVDLVALAVETEADGGVGGGFAVQVVDEDDEGFGSHDGDHLRICCRVKAKISRAA